MGKLAAFFEEVSSHRELAELLDVSQRTIERWSSAGLVGPKPYIPALVFLRAHLADGRRDRPGSLDLASPFSGREPSGRHRELLELLERHGWVATALRCRRNDSRRFG